MNKKYYLDTNILYYFEEEGKLAELSKYENVATSLFALQEIILRLDDNNFEVRQSIVRTIINNRVRIYPYLPSECIESGLHLQPLAEDEISILNLKRALNDKIKILCKAKSYDEYCRELIKIGIDVKTNLEEEIFIKKNNREKLSLQFKNSNQLIRQKKKEQRVAPTYTKISIDDLIIGENTEDDKRTTNKLLIEPLLTVLDINISQEHLDVLYTIYEGELNAFLAGTQIYNLVKSLNNEDAGGNDIADLTHLLYLRSEHDFIVSEDKIFKILNGFRQRIYFQDFKNIFDL